MSDLPGYDDWKTHNPEHDNCEHCGATPCAMRAGWQPKACTGECGYIFRDPDADYDARRDEPELYDP